ncbi:MAG: response regulator [Deltaproteobacteria bacterium]|nr:response regulator [Deltaproteobacteria bacterium]
MRAPIVELKERRPMAGVTIEPWGSPTPSPDGNALATLAGGIAHQFNNALFGITGNLELLKLEFPDRILENHLQGMQESIHRMLKLTNQLMAYARQGKYQPEICRLNDLVRETLSELILDPASSIAIETDLSPDARPVEVDRAQMGMVISALLANSMEALNGRGLIRISVRNLEVPGPPENGMNAGSCVRLRVEDNGVGMSEEAKKRAFEPFFTTKFYGRGLGLPAASGIVANHGGAIRVESKQGAGTRVDVTLPQWEGRAPGHSRTETHSSAESGVVLVVEDDEVVMDVTGAMLERLGFQVLRAGTGTEAIRISRNFPGHIRLAILDISLPDMDGKGIYPEVVQSHPEMRAIVSSGHLCDLPSHEMTVPGVKGFLQKPFTLQALTDKIHEVLAGE